MTASNSQEVLQRVDETCPNQVGVKAYEHVVLEGGKAMQAQVYLVSSAERYATA